MPGHLGLQGEPVSKEKYLSPAYVSNFLLALPLHPGLSSVEVRGQFSRVSSLFVLWILGIEFRSSGLCIFLSSWPSSLSFCPPPELDIL